MLKKVLTKFYPLVVFKKERTLRKKGKDEDHKHPHVTGGFSF